MDKVNDDSLLNMLRMLQNHEIASFAQSSRIFTEVVRRFSSLIFPNANGSELTLNSLAGGNHMRLRRLQASIERVGHIPPTEVLTIDNFTLLILFQRVTYDKNPAYGEPGHCSPRPVINTTNLCTKWVPLNKSNCDGGSICIDLSNDKIPVQRADWHVTNPRYNSTGFQYGKQHHRVKVHSAGETEFVVKVLVYRHDNGSAANLFTSGRYGRMTNVDDRMLDFECGHVPNDHEVKQAHIQVMANLEWTLSPEEIEEEIVKEERREAEHSENLAQSLYVNNKKPYQSLCLLLPDFCANMKKEGNDVDMVYSLITTEEKKLYFLRGLAKKIVHGSHVFWRKRKKLMKQNQGCPFSFLNMHFSYVWSQCRCQYGDQEWDEVKSLRTDRRSSLPALFTHRLRWLPVDSD